MKQHLSYAAILLCVSFFNSCFGPFNPYDWPPEDPESDSSGVTQDGLIIYFSCDDSSGSLLHDSVGDFDATISGAVFREGIRGTGLHFNGRDDFALIPDSDNELLMFGTGDFSISVVVKPEIYLAVTDTTRLDIISKGVIREKGYTVAIDESSFTALLGGTNYDIKDTQFDALDESWYHLVLTRNSGEVRLYVNARQIVRYTNNESMSVPDAKFIIGNNSSVGSTNGFSGMIDEIRVYNRALDGRKIQAMCTAYGLE